MTKFTHFLSIITLLIVGISCSKELNNPGTSNQAIFEEAWDYTDRTYSMFELKKINWDAIKIKYQAKINEQLSQDSLFQVLGAMVNELKDGHCLLANNQGENIGYDYIQGFEVNFDLRQVVPYLKEPREWSRSLATGIINDSIGYAYYASFENREAGDWPMVMNYFAEKKVKKIILDIRNNGGGDQLIAVDICGYFVKTPTLLGTMYQKSGPDRNDFLPPLSIKATPKAPYLGNIKTVLLTNRVTFSAGSYLSGMVKALPNVRHYGQITGGGGGGQLAYELPNGWVISITTNYFLDVNQQHIELGVKPQREINNTSTDMLQKKDRMLEFAIAN
jgi:hypothetical protein